MGYQADIGKGWWGSLYHEHGRRILGKNKLKEGEYLKPEQWNNYEILAVGHRIWLAINGKVTVALRDPIGDSMDKFHSKFTVVSPENYLPQPQVGP